MAETYETRARACAVIGLVSVATWVGSLYILLHLSNPPLALLVFLSPALALALLMTAVSAVAWYVNHKEGN